MRGLGRQRAEAKCNNMRGEERVRQQRRRWRVRGRGTGKEERQIIGFQGGTTTDGSGLSSLISSSQRYLTFLCIISSCCQSNHWQSVKGDYRIKLITYRNDGGMEWQQERRDRHPECAERIRLEISEKMTRSNYILFFFCCRFLLKYFGKRTVCQVILDSHAGRTVLEWIFLPSLFEY